MASPQSPTVVAKMTAEAASSNALARLQKLLGHDDDSQKAVDASRKALFTQVVVLDLARQKWDAPQPFMRETRLSNGVECFYLRSQHRLQEAVASSPSGLKEVLLALDFAEEPLRELARCLHRIVPSRARNKQFAMDCVGTALAAWILAKQVNGCLQAELRKLTSEGVTKDDNTFFLLVRPIAKEIESRLADFRLIIASLMLAAGVLIAPADQLCSAVTALPASKGGEADARAVSSVVVDAEPLDRLMMEGVIGARSEEDIPALVRAKRWGAGSGDLEKEAVSSLLFGDTTLPSDTFPELLSRLYSSWLLQPVFSLLPTHETRKLITRTLKEKRHELGKWDWPRLTAEEEEAKAKLDALLKSMEEGSRDSSFEASE